ncbi:hypothetical protein TFLX_05522 [Thermoflexales bacterium]|nr:hypothetical protein TFLX_05522 [Thermoflexales bacterium]
MRRFFTSTAPTVITGIAGLIVLLSFIFPQYLLAFRVVLINIAVIVAGMALLLGFVRLLNLHLRRVQQRKNFYSLIALIVALLVFAVLSVERLLNLFNANQPAAGLPLNSLVFNSVIGPIQSTLGALLAVFLGVAAVRMAQRRRTWGTLWFLVSAIVVLLTQIPVTDALLPIRQFFDALAMGGLRGLLLGVALGTLAVAFRVLLAIDRPQGE